MNNAKIRILICGLVPWIIALLILVYMVKPVSSEILPNTRRIIWEGNVGVKGDIPTTRTVYSTANAATYGNGVNDARAHIQGLINACPSGRVVYLPAGTYIISSELAMKAGVTLRGSGINNTIIKGTASFGSDKMINFGDGYSYGISINLSSGYTKGSTTITTSSNHGYSVGDYILIDQLNDTSGDPVITSTGIGGTCNWCSRSSGTRVNGQVNRVASVPANNQITLEIPLYWTLKAALTPQVSKLSDPTSGMGIENLRLDNSNSASTMIVNANNAVDSWILNVDFLSSYSSMLRIYGGYRITVRGCVFREGNPVGSTSGTPFGSGRGYVIFPIANTVSALLIENNIFYHAALAFAGEAGTGGNVFAYNYVGQMYHGSTDLAGGGMTNLHGSFVYMSLWEGNQSASRFTSDSYWGSSAYNTLFRNKIDAMQTYATGKSVVELLSLNNYFNFVGNVLGTLGRETVYEFSNQTKIGTEKVIYTFGYSEYGGGSSGDTSVKTTAYRHGNWDSVNNSTLWNSTNTDHTIPSSLYRSTIPSWWCNETPWPPIGSDLSPMVSDIPAKRRYDGATCTSGFGTNKIPLPPAIIGVN